MSSGGAVQAGNENQMDVGDVNVILQLGSEDRLGNAQAGEPPTFHL